LERLFYICGSVAGMAGVALGAFAAHALKARLSAEMLAVFETGVRYQMYHALALFAVAWGHSRWQGKWFPAAGWLFVAGILIFSGSLYVLALTGVKWLGMITPIGGLSFLAGWLCLAWGARYKLTA
jgi:uncharacterized membrane protein YgdD (TMEM256/DUF423 family)